LKFAEKGISSGEKAERKIEEAEMERGVLNEGIERLQKGFKKFSGPPDHSSTIEIMISWRDLL
jgi:hypothetical protein